MCQLFIPFVLLLFDLHISLCTLCTDNPNNITLDIITKNENGNSYLSCNSKDTYTLLEGDDAEVVINNKYMINEAWCHFSKNQQRVYTGEFICKNKEQTKLKIIKTQAASWSCTFLILRGVDTQSAVTHKGVKYTQIICTFDVHVRLTNGPSISINKVPVETKRQDELTSEYDYFGYYYFQPGLPVNIDCFRPKENSGSLQMTLTSASSGQKFVNTSHEYMNRTIWTKLTEEYNNSYLDCSYETNENSLLVRVHMYEKKLQKTEKEIDVDGPLVNNIIESKDDNTSLYYKYTDIEEMNLKCSMDCSNKYCLMEIWCNENKLNYTQWMYNVKIEVSHTFLLTPADKSFQIKCVGFHKPATEILTAYKFITFMHVNDQIKESTTTIRTNGCSNAEKNTDTDVNCSTNSPNNKQHATSTTLLPTTSQPSTVSDFPKSFKWSIVSALLVLAVLILIVCLVCVRRKRNKKPQRPQLPLPESTELDTIPNASQNNEPPVYEEIPDTVTRQIVPDRRQPDTVTRPGIPDRRKPDTVTLPGIPDRRKPDTVTLPGVPDRRQPDTVTRTGVPDRRQLRRIPDMRLDRQNGRLIVKGKAIDLQKLLREAEYVETE